MTLSKISESDAQSRLALSLESAVLGQTPSGRIVGPGKSRRVKNHLRITAKVHGLRCCSAQKKSPGKKTPRPKTALEIQLKFQVRGNPRSHLDSTRTAGFAKDPAESGSIPDVGFRIGLANPVKQVPHISPDFQVHSLPEFQ